MAENTPTPPETQCELCQDAKARKLAGYSLATIACEYHKGDMQKACLALIVPLEQDPDVDPVAVVKKIMLLDGNGKSIDATAELFTSIIEEAAMEAAKEFNETQGNPA